MNKKAQRTTVFFEEPLYCGFDFLRIHFDTTGINNVVESANLAKASVVNQLDNIVCNNLFAYVWDVQNKTITMVYIEFNTG